MAVKKTKKAKVAALPENAIWSPAFVVHRLLLNIIADFAVIEVLDEPALARLSHFQHAYLAKLTAGIEAEGIHNLDSSEKLARFDWVQFVEEVNTKISMIAGRPESFPYLKRQLIVHSTMAYGLIERWLYAVGAMVTNEERGAAQTEAARAERKQKRDNPKTEKIKAKLAAMEANGYDLQGRSIAGIIANQLNVSRSMVRLVREEWLAKK